MGTSLALTGAYLLAGELSNLFSASDLPSVAFDRFESLFRPFVDKTQDIPFFVPAIVHPATAWKRWVLQSLISVGVRIANISWVSNLFASSPDKEDFVLPHFAQFQA
jgi:2-polyprenyl-6-methoxyphenol hydroxylase-like FAD-dependent oxidoreductase